MDAARAFRPFGLAHLIVMALTISLPFVLAAFVRKSRWARSERIIARLFAVLLLANYVGYEIYLALTEGLAWQKALPFQLCDWAMVAIAFMMIVKRFQPHWFSIVRTFAWSELYFVIAITVDLLTGENYGYLLHKPAAASLLDALSDHRVVYILQMHLLALVFFVVLYLPFALYDMITSTRNKLI